jgi:hypothetical protein
VKCGERRGHEEGGIKDSHPGHLTSEHGIVHERSLRLGWDDVKRDRGEAASASHVGNSRSTASQAVQASTLGVPSSRLAALDVDEMAGNELARAASDVSLLPMSTVLEIESALKGLPLQEARKLAIWLQQYLDQQTTADEQRAMPSEATLPDYAARRRRIFGDKVLPNMVILAREEERW